VPLSSLHLAIIVMAVAFLFVINMPNQVAQLDGLLFQFIYYVGSILTKLIENFIK